MDGELIEGSVLWFDNAAGFGFVEGPRGEPCFVPWDAVERAGINILAPHTRVRVRLLGGRVVELEVLKALE
jgi:cold shock CspA family protein